MKPLSIRWRLTLTTMALAGAAAGLLVFLVQKRTSNELLTQLERQLATKFEEVATVLETKGSTFDWRSFVEVETNYSATPYEYFYEFVDEDGVGLLHSRNLGASSLEDRAPAEPGGAVLATLQHPREPEESVLVRSQRLSPDFELNGRRGVTLRVAVSLRPLEEAVTTSLKNNLLEAGAGLAALFGTLWIVVGRSLRRVSEITQRAASITATSLRERLPLNGSNDELDQLSSVLNRMLDGLECSLLQMEDFTSDAAHQLRTPLTRLRCELDLVLQGDDGLQRETRERLDEMRGELERLGQTCSRLLLLARLDRGALEHNLLADETDLVAVVAELIDQISPLAAEKGVTLHSVTGMYVPIRCSKPLLVEALINLLDNALRFSSPGDTIAVLVTGSGGEATVTVADQGPGVPEELREKVFRRFFRVHTDSRGEGTGIGLSIVRGIARAHGGDVHVEAGKRGGASFVLRLPLLVDFSSGPHSTLRPAS